MDFFDYEGLLRGWGLFFGNDAANRAAANWPRRIGRPPVLLPCRPRKQDASAPHAAGAQPWREVGHQNNDSKTQARYKEKRERGKINGIKT